jgi:hypothetical protein
VQRYVLPLLSYADKTKSNPAPVTSEGTLFPSTYLNPNLVTDLYSEISKRVFCEKSQEYTPTTLAPDVASRKNSSRVSSPPTKTLRKEPSYSSLDFYLPKPGTPKFERSIFYENSSPKVVSEEAKERGKSMTKAEMWNTPLMSRTQLVLADADRRVKQAF